MINKEIGYALEEFELNSSPKSYLQFDNLEELNECITINKDFEFTLKSSIFNGSTLIHLVEVRNR